MMRTTFESIAPPPAPELPDEEEMIIRTFAETLAAIDDIPLEIKRSVEITSSGKASGSDNEGNGYVSQMS